MRCSSTRLTITEELMPASSHISLKRVYELPEESDGLRLLVERLWPRGLKKEDAKVDEWLHDLAPSNELRKWFHAHPDRWTDFRRKYLQELRGVEAAKALARLSELLLAHNNVTFVFASKNEDRNNAVILKEVMEGTKKPPHATRSGLAQARRSRRTRR